MNNNIRTHSVTHPPASWWCRRNSELEVLACHSYAVWPWACSLRLLNLSTAVCKLRYTIGALPHPLLCILVFWASIPSPSASVSVGSYLQLSSKDCLWIVETCASSLQESRGFLCPLLGSPSLYPVTGWSVVWKPSCLAFGWMHSEGVTHHPELPRLLRGRYLKSQPRLLSLLPNPSSCTSLLASPREYFLKNITWM